MILIYHIHIFLYQARPVSHTILISKIVIGEGVAIVAIMIITGCEMSLNKG